jgi:hypothetical protein
MNTSPRGWFEEEVRRVRKLISASLIACMLALMSMLSVPAIAGPCCDDPLPLKCTIDLVIDLNAPDAHWEGPIAGDVGGTLQLWEHWSEIFFVGATEHYFEDFVILVGDDYIKGSDQGVYNFGTLRFSYTGSVTDATGAWSYLLGWNMHGKGVAFADPNDADILTAEGTMMLVPP